MQATRQPTRDYLFLYALTISMLCVAFMADQNSATAEEEKFDRAQNLVVNLNKVQGCAGWYLLQDIRKVQEMDHDLGKAHFQIEEADKNYAKLRGKPDDRYLSTLTMKVEKAQQDRKMLEDDLHEAFDQLRTSIKEVLMTDPERRNKKH
jgi:hypothetical protein